MGGQFPGDNDLGDLLPPHPSALSRNIPAIYVKHLDDPDRDLRVSENVLIPRAPFNAVFSPCGVAQLGTAKIESAEKGASACVVINTTCQGSLCRFHGNTTGTDIFLPRRTSSATALALHLRRQRFFLGKMAASS